MDGKFGPATHTAVIAFQKANCPKADGVVGKDTWAALDKGPPVTKVEKTGPASHFPETYVDAVEQLKKLKVGDTMTSAMKDAALPPTFTSREEAVDWLRKVMKGDEGTEKVVTQYQGIVDSLLTTDVDKLLDRAASVKSVLAKGKFQLIPDPPHDWDFWPSWPRSTQNTWWRYLWPADNHHFWGILFSIGLLSLGAPFWFNVLKTLSALRPILASKQEKERRGSGHQRQRHR